MLRGGGVAEEIQRSTTDERAILPELPFARSGEAVLQQLRGSLHGLSIAEAAARLTSFGPNSLPETKPPGLFRVFLSQFLSPLIYVLLAAATLSTVIGEYSDAGFIAGVLLINALIGMVQEYSAQQAASALKGMVAARARVLRDGDLFEVEARDLVPGDLVLLESGDRVPADLRLLSERDLVVDESLLTGESLAVGKDAAELLAEDCLLADRRNMVFAGTMVGRGRAEGIVTATGLDSELGKIAADVLQRPSAKAPLQVRLERFTRRIGLLVLGAALVMAAVALMRGETLADVFMLAVALAVSVIPEGLPVALTVALAIGMRRMARRHVIVRRLVAVEALGSCTCIATDKTGTLTVNQLTTRLIALADGDLWPVTGEGIQPDGMVSTAQGSLTPQQEMLLERICHAAVLANEAWFGHRDGSWVGRGDAVDLALLVLGHKAGVVRPELLTRFPEVAAIPFESERMFSASVNATEQGRQASVKGALERLLPMCERMATAAADLPIDPAALLARAQGLAEQGYRVLGLAAGPVDVAEDGECSVEQLRGLTLLGLVGMIDPLRSEAQAAVVACRSAGIEVTMITGDHPATAMAIGRELKLAADGSQVVSGADLKKAADAAEFDAMVGRARVFARVEPQQKLEIVGSLQRQGHFVAVSGDGANDAPALRAAEVGVAMGRSGTDVARETAEIIITDDNFASIVAGVEEGRIAYANVRKVVFLLISTGAAELVLFTLALFTGLPLPLLPVQLLWLNLVTNGIQDVALAFEPGEGNEMRQPPRPPQEAIFNRLMIERVVLSALLIGIAAFVIFSLLLELGYSLDAARNQTLLLMVLFENIHVFNSRSETLSAFRHNPLRNPFLLVGTLAAQLIHILAMYTPGISDILRIAPVSLLDWSELLLVAFSALVVMELHKLYWQAMVRRG